MPHLKPLVHSRTNVNVILVYNSITDLVIAPQKGFCCRILTTAVKSLQVELWKRLMVYLVTFRSSRKIKLAACVSYFDLVFVPPAGEISLSGLD